MPGQFHGPVERRGRPDNALVLGGTAQRQACVLGAQGADLGKVGEPLGVGLGPAGQTGQRRKPRTGHHERQLLLAHPVQADDQRRQVLPRQVLSLVDGQEHPNAGIPSHLSYLDKQVRQILIQDPRVRPAPGGIGLQGHIHPDIGHPIADPECRQHPERPLGPVLHPIPDPQAQQRLAHQDSNALCEGEVHGDLDLLVGDDTVLGTDPGYRWSHWQEALWVLSRLDEHRVWFAEAPLRHDDIEGYRQLAARCSLLIGAGEFSTGRWEAKEWLDRAKVPLLHCGISRAGGFTEIARIAEMCELAGALLMPHAYASGISDYCNVHMQIASMQIPMIEFRTVEPVTSILRRDLVYPAMPAIVDGWIAPPTAPGLGIELNMDLVRRFQLP